MAGLTGLVTSYELKKGFDVEIIEQSNQVGGLAKSIKINKDVDLGPHIYHSPIKTSSSIGKNFQTNAPETSIGQRILRMYNFMIILLKRIY